MRLVAPLLILLVLPTLAVAIPRTTGPATLLCIRIDFPDRPGDPCGTVDPAETFRRLDDFYRENSFDQLSVHTTITPVLRIPKPESSYKVPDDYQRVQDDSVALARAAGFDPARFDCFLTVWNSRGPGSGIGAIGGRNFWLVNGFCYAGAVHEFGHTLGLGHARLWRTDDGSVIGPGFSQDYGDPFDPMGGGADTPRYHLSIPAKARFHWVPVTQVNRPGTYRIYAHDAAPHGARRPSDASYGLRIPRDGTQTYWVEFRQLVTDNPDLTAGVRLLRTYADKLEPDLLDVTPDSPAGPRDAALLPGRTFADPQAGIYITPLSVHDTTPRSIDVAVRRGVHGPPAAAPEIRAIDPTPEGPATFSFDATLNDSSNAALTQFWDFGDQTFATGPQPRHTYKDADRSYVVRMIANDLQGASADRIQVLSVGHPSTLTLTGTLTTADDRPLPDARVTAAGAACVTDSLGRFAIPNLAPGAHTVRANLHGYTILPRDAGAEPIRLVAHRSDTPANAKRLSLRIHAHIDGDDTLVLSAKRATWSHGNWQWPTEITINGVPLDPRRPLSNTGASAFLPAPVDLSSATVKSQSGRGTIDLRLAGATLLIHFDDPQPGAGDYNLELLFRPLR